MLLSPQSCVHPQRWSRQPPRACPSLLSHPPTHPPVRPSASPAVDPPIHVNWMNTPSLRNDRDGQGRSGRVGLAGSPKLLATQISVQEHIWGCICDQHPPQLKTRQACQGHPCFLEPHRAQGWALSNSMTSDPRNSRHPVRGVVVSRGTPTSGPSKALTPGPTAPGTRTCGAGG